MLGGGVIEKVDLLFNVAAKTARSAALACPRQQVEIVHTGLGDYSGVVGAAVLAHEARGGLSHRGQGSGRFSLAYDPYMATSRLGAVRR